MEAPIGLRQQLALRTYEEYWPYVAGVYQALIEMLLREQISPGQVGETLLVIEEDKARRFPNQTFTEGASETRVAAVEVMRS